jgi:type I restriction enzyme S subunit
MNNLQVNINDLVFQFQQKLKDLEELKKSILQKAFSGELTQKEVVV